MWKKSEEKFYLKIALNLFLQLIFKINYLKI